MDFASPSLSHPSLWTLKFTVPAYFKPDVDNWIDENMPLAASDFEAKDNPAFWEYHILFDAAQGLPSLKDFFSFLPEEAQSKLSAVTFEPTQADNWLQKNYEAFPSFQVGDFYVFGSHAALKPVPESLIGLQIDAATAFGSGEHPTTQGCLHLIHDLANTPGLAQNMPPSAPLLDLGTGSGILAIALAKCFANPVVGADNDPEAVLMADLHARLNHVEGRITNLLTGHDLQGDLASYQPFGLIVANILLDPLLELARTLTGLLADQGYIILSGILDSQMMPLETTYKALGFRSLKQYSHHGWSALLLEYAPLI